MKSTVFAALLLALSGVPGARAETAMKIVAGSIARSEVVALGRDLVVEGEVTSDVAVVNGDATVSGRIAGDIVVLGGSVRLEEGAQVSGDVFALGGTIDTAGAIEIGGRLVAYPTIGAAWLTLLEGPSLGLSAGSRVVLAAKLALLTAWLALSLLLLAVNGGAVLATSQWVLAESLRNFLAGLTGVLALFLLALALVTFVPGIAGVPLLVLVVVFGLLLKLWGMVAVFHALGEWVGNAALRRRMQPLNAATLGLVILGAIKLLPWVGTVVWWTATFVGIGVALRTKLGRHEPWIEPAPLAEPSLS